MNVVLRANTETGLKGMGYGSEKWNHLTKDRILGRAEWTIHFHTRQGRSKPPERLLASQNRVFSMELVPTGAWHCADCHNQRPGSTTTEFLIRICCPRFSVPFRHNVDY